MIHRKDVRSCAVMPLLLFRQGRRQQDLEVGSGGRGLQRDAGARTRAGDGWAQNQAEIILGPNMNRKLT